MNWLDIIIALPVLWLGYKGFKNGLVKEIASLAALFLGLWVAVVFSHYLEDLISSNTNIDENYIPLTAFAVLFILTVIAVHLLSRSLDKLIKAVAMNWLNKITGTVFGAAKALLIIGALIFLFDQVIVVKLDLIPQSVLDNSLLYQPLQELIEFVYPKLKNIRLEDLQIPQFNNVN
ncbi:MAG: CvpA family protein [Bacteroidales bacterium]